MRKVLLGLSALVVVAAAGAFGWLSYSAATNLARPTAIALAALQGTAEVATEDSGDWVVMRPRDREPDFGVVVYPGAYCDVRGYAPVMREIARAGYLVVGISMPFNLSVLAPNSADAVRKAFPGIRRWVIVGHSMGGAMAGYYASRHQGDLAGVIFWDAYPPESSSLAATPLPVVHIHRATLDGQAPDVFEARRQLFPPGGLWIPIRGGIHMYFGSFNGGNYKEIWTPKITEAEQLREVGAATIAALAGMR